MGLALCFVSLAASLALSSASIGRGLGWVIFVGCVSGWLRCRIFDGFAHFIFDAAILGWYLQCFRFHMRSAEPAARVVDSWVLVLCALPILVLLASPLIGGQPFLVQLVGLRSSVLFVPALAMSARMTQGDMQEVARWSGAAIILATLFAVGEAVFGVETFFPPNEATAAMYQTYAVEGRSLRIPASFASAHLYGGTLVALIPILWTRLEGGTKKRALTGLFLVCAASAAFVCSSRTPVIALAALLVTAVALGRRSPLLTAGALAAVVGIWVIAGSDERFRRYETLASEGAVSERVQSSVNQELLDVIVDAPLGRGLASGGGTSIPYFLAEDALPQVGLESEVSRIALELGVLGLVAWVLFVARSVAAGFVVAQRSRDLSSALMFVSVTATAATALIGVGAMSAIPTTLIIFVQVGWLSKQQIEIVRKGRAAKLEELVLSA